MAEDNTVSFGDIEVTHDGEMNNLVFIVRDLRMAFTKNGSRLFNAEEFKGTASYSGVLISADDDTNDALQDIISALVDEHLKGKRPKNDDYICLKVGNDMVDKDGEVYDGFEDNLAIKFKNKEGVNDAPQVYSEAKELIEEFPDKRVFKDGCTVDAQIRLYAYAGENNGISAECQALIMVDKGTPFAGGSSGSTDATGLLAGREAKTDDADSVFGSKRKKK